MGWSKAACSLRCDHDEEMNGVFFSGDACGERTGTIVVAVPGDNMQVDFLGDFPDAVRRLGGCQFLPVAVDA